MKNQYSMKNTNYAKYEIGGKKKSLQKMNVLCRKHTLLFHRSIYTCTHPPVSQEYTHPEDTPHKIPLTLYQMFPFTQWLNITLKPVPPHPLFHLSGDVSTWATLTGFGGRMLPFLYVSLGVTTAKQMHYRELIWSQWCSPQTQTLKESQPTGFSEDSSVLKQQSQKNIKAMRKTCRYQVLHVSGRHSDIYWIYLHNNFEIKCYEILTH